MWDCIAVGAGGCIGAICRYLIGKISLEMHGFPFWTLCINILGSFVIGCIVSIAAKNPEMDPRMILFLKVGICGGFTTFSTFSLETSQLMQNGQTAMALVYVLASLILGVIAVWIPQAWIR